jgi:hypothetical protein
MGNSFFFHTLRSSFQWIQVIDDLRRYKQSWLKHLKKDQCNFGDFSYHQIQILYNILDSNTGCSCSAISKQMSCYPPTLDPVLQIFISVRQAWRELHLFKSKNFKESWWVDCKFFLLPQTILLQLNAGDGYLKHFKQNVLGRFKMKIQVFMSEDFSIIKFKFLEKSLNSNTGCSWSTVS